MDWNDPSALRQLSIIVQWVAIVLVFIGGALQVCKHVIDTREKRLSAVASAANEDAQRKREEELKQKLASSQKQIRTLSLQLEVDVTAKWKDGKIPDPARWLMMSGTRAATAAFVLRDGREINVEFHRADNLKLTDKGDGITALTYRSSAEPASDIYTLQPEDISGVRGLSFTCVFSPAQLADLALKIGKVRAVFYVNGRASFAVDKNVDSVQEYIDSEGRAPWWTILDTLQVRPPGAD